MAAPKGYFITFRTHGTWLPGDERGSVRRLPDGIGRRHIPESPKLNGYASGLVGGDAFLLCPKARAVVERTIKEVCEHRGWHLFTVNARSNHVHIVAHGQLTPERMMNDFKSWSTRRLREGGFASADRQVWARHGSTIWLNTKTQLEQAVVYVRDWQEGARFELPEPQGGMGA